MEMFVRVVLCLVSFAANHVQGQSTCTDLRGRQISHGLHFVPGPDTCTLCVCDNGLPKVCKAVLCSPPQDCRSFRVGNTCCDFICLDDVVKPSEGSETNVRVAATGAALVIIITIILLVYKMKKFKIARLPPDDQRSLTSIGYISGSMGYMGGTCETALGAWKPPGHYLPRGEAPPPYDEAMAQSRESRPSEQCPRPAAPTAEHMCAHYANLPRHPQQMANPQACFTAPLLQPMPADSQLQPMHHPMAANLLGFPRGVRLTGSLGAISGRVPRDAREVLHNQPLPSYYARSPALHRTIPRISTAESTLLDAPLAFSRTDRAGVEVRRSFHKPAERMTCDTGRSMPRYLNLASAAPEPVPRQIVQQTRSNPEPTPRIEPAEFHTSMTGSTDQLAGRSRFDSHVTKTTEPTRMFPERIIDQAKVPDTYIKTLAERGTKTLAENGTKKMAEHGAKTIDERGSKTIAEHGARKELTATRTLSDPSTANATLPLTVDKPSCVCSYSEATAPGAEDADDYRNECENCKATNSSRWVLEDAFCEEEETQTLQRRPLPSAPPPPATATLPPSLTKPRPTMGQPSNWESWFHTIPDTDSGSDGE